MSILELYEHSWNPEKSHKEYEEESKIVLYVTIGVCIPVIIIAFILVLAVCYQTSKVMKRKVTARKQHRSKKLSSKMTSGERSAPSDSVLDAVSEAVRKVTAGNTNNNDDELHSVTVVNSSGAVELASKRNFIWNETSAVGSLDNGAFDESDSDMDSLDETESAPFANISNINSEKVLLKYSGENR